MGKAIKKEQIAIIIVIAVQFIFMRAGVDAEI